jgi:hypothetical protein
MKKGSDVTADSGPPVRRKPYTPPRLVSYGHVKDLVQGNAGGMPDSGTTMMCRVAEALYGADDVRTHLLRGWFAAVHSGRQRGWLLVEVYRRIGPMIARSILAGRLPRRPFQRLFDGLVARAFDRWARFIVNDWHRRAV